MLLRLILVLFCVNVFKPLWRSLEKWRSYEVGSETWKREQSPEGGAPKWAAEQSRLRTLRRPHWLTRAISIYRLPGHESCHYLGERRAPPSRCSDECRQELVGKVDTRANPATPRRQGLVRIDQALPWEKNQLSRQPGTILPIPSQNCVVLLPGIPPGSRARCNALRSVRSRFVRSGARHLRTGMCGRRRSKAPSREVSRSPSNYRSLGWSAARCAAHPCSSRKRRLITILARAPVLISNNCISGLP